jgi:glycosyltransferase involved in cell wall biosynthesis
MRVAFLTPEYATADAPDGGLANYVRKTARALAARGHDLVVLTLARADRVFDEDGVAVHALARQAPLPIALAGAVTASAVDLVRLRRRFGRLERQARFDVVQSASYLAPGLLLLPGRRAPLVCRLSSHSPTVRAAFGRPTTPQDFAYDWLELQLAKRADACFAPSRLVADQYQRLLGRPVEVVRTPIDAIEAAPDDSDFDRARPAGPYLLFFGTLSPIKGVDLLADVLPEVLARHPSLHVLFIGRDDGLGDGSPAMARIRQRCARFGDRVAHLPPLPRARLQPFIAHALGVLMPSRVDNYPNSCLEAQALGVPVVGSDGSSLEEMMTDGVTGFLARQGDRSSLADAIERLVRLSEPERAGLRARILDGVAAAQRDDRIAQLVALYERVRHG